MRKTLDILLIHLIVVLLAILSGCEAYHKVHRRECYHQGRDIIGSFKRDTNHVDQILINMPRLEIITIRAFHKVEARYIGGLDDGGPILAKSGVRVYGYSIGKGYWYVRDELLFVKMEGHKETLQFEYTTNQLKLDRSNTVYVRL